MTSIISAKELLKKIRKGPAPPPKFEQRGEAGGIKKKTRQNLQRLYDSDDDEQLPGVG
jgi:hypothetical protein